MTNIITAFSVIFQNIARFRNKTVLTFNYNETGKSGCMVFDEFKEPVESFCFQIRSIIGRRKAAVLPEPVIEEARTSRPVMIAGIVISWTSVGCENSRS